ncbi:hypothetical protein BC937DRAFT_93573, partial [Endogone sp. FLAS-F59071]
EHLSCDSNPARLFPLPLSLSLSLSFFFLSSDTCKSCPRPSFNFLIPSQQWHLKVPTLRASCKGSSKRMNASSNNWTSLGSRYPRQVNPSHSIVKTPRTTLFPPCGVLATRIPGLSSNEADARARLCRMRASWLSPLPLSLFSCLCLC